MINFKIDEVLPCLKKVETGEIYETEVKRICTKKILSKFNRKTGWYVNWSKFPEGTEVYALVIKGTNDIQGLVAIERDSNAKAVYIVWGCTAPHNNKWLYKKQEYAGVGGHLIAIASEISVKSGFDGYVYAEASCEELYNYYCEEFGATYLPPINNPYRFLISAKATEKIREVYNYEWSDEIL